MLALLAEPALDKSSLMEKGNQVILMSPGVSLAF